MIICVVGPTATGKTELGVELALRLGGEIISGDSMQLYRGMDIGTAKATIEERRGVTHHMIDILEAGEDYSVAAYVEDAGKCADALLSRGMVPIVVGGTGLYVDSFIKGRSFTAFSSQRRKELETLRDELGNDAVFELLCKYDPESAETIHPNNTKRVIRALEVYFESGKTISQHNRETKLQPPRYDALWIGLEYADRQTLYQRIEARVDIMLEKGLLREVQALLDRGVSEGSTAMQAIGYKELVQYLKGSVTLDEAVSTIKTESRRYAKRQLTWFKRNQTINWFEREKYKRCDALVDFIQKSWL